MTFSVVFSPRHVVSQVQIHSFSHFFHDLPHMRPQKQARSIQFGANEAFSKC